jgi:superfamily II DNA or RNA helicase
MRWHARGLDIAYFPRDKRSIVRSLLVRHRSDPTIVFTARTEDAYRVATDSLVPVITAEVGARERARILEKFKDGRVRAIATARVLNEGVDVPDARVAIVVAGTLGAREHVQRIGRVLRPSPGKRALAYELVTVDTVDEKLSRSRAARDGGAHGSAATL